MTLGELCDLVAGRVALFVEIKSRFDGDLRLARRTAQVLSAYRGPVAADVVRSGADRGPARSRAGPGARSRYAAAGPERTQPDGLSAPRCVLQALAARPQFLAHGVQDLASPVPRAARHLLGLPLLTWTVRTPAERARAARYADQIIFEGFRP